MWSAPPPRPTNLIFNGRYIYIFYDLQIILEIMDNNDMYISIYIYMYEYVFVNIYIYIHTLTLMFGYLLPQLSGGCRANLMEHLHPNSGEGF